MAAEAKPLEAKTEEAKAADPKAKGAGDEDLSMEEILQSIRRIIAEDDKEGKKPVAADNAKTNGTKTADVPGSDVLELTELVKEDGTIESLKDKPAAKEAASADVLNKIDEALTPEKPAEKPMEKPVEPPVVKAEEKPAAATPAPAAPAPAAAAPADSLLSSDAATAAAESFKKLKSVEPEAAAPVSTTPAPAFRDGATVEDLVTEMLRPMMKAWLDVNLPAIVERIVEREVKKLTR